MNGAQIASLIMSCTSMLIVFVTLAKEKKR